LINPEAVNNKLQQPTPVQTGVFAAYWSFFAFSLLKKLRAKGRTIYLFVEIDNCGVPGRLTGKIF